ncbi:hypothetical protein VTI74DRAFT_10581 [Chaetomium olivicolor]
MMDDAVRPNAETFRHYYARGYRTWQSLLQRAASFPGFPTDLVDFEHACPRHPFLHSGLGLKPGYNFQAAGTSTWRTGTGSSDDCDLPPFQQRYFIPVTARRPIAVSIDPSPERFSTWFRDQGNHVSILTLAWAYVLSARWAEIVPGTTPLEYTESRAGWGQPDTTSSDASGNEILVDLGPVPDVAARWWAAILAPNQGWTTGICHKDRLLAAPWSTALVQANRPFVLSRTSTTAEPPSRLPAPSFSVAAGFIAAYSAYHGVEDQSRAALAAALMLPLAGCVKSTISLPAPQVLSFNSHHSRSSASTDPQNPMLWGHDDHQLDRLLTLSCNNFNIPSLLSSVIFEPGVPCNACGAWVQGSFAVLDSDQAKTNLQLLAGTLMARNPKLGFLWLGAALLGIHDFVLRGMRVLFYPIDLTLAGWTDTLMSFIQEPVENTSPARDSAMTRADECRLMFLCHSMRHSFPPLAAFQPFGTTALADCGLDVREHVFCSSRHGLYYSSWTWDCQDGSFSGLPAPQSVQMPLLADARTPKREDEDLEIGEESKIVVDYSHMDRKNDCSERATRNIFMWLRGMVGFPITEREIREHEWFEDLFDSDNESCSPEVNGSSTVGGNVNIGSWIERTVTHRRNSFH